MQLSFNRDIAIVLLTCVLGACARPAPDLPPHRQASSSMPAATASHGRDAAQILQHAQAALARQEYRTALEALYPLSQEGNAEAQVMLGSMYLEGQGVPNDEVEALRLAQRAAAQGNADGQWLLGSMYEHGRGVTRNLIEAQRWYGQVAATSPPGAKRDRAVQAHERVAQLLGMGAPQAGVPQPLPLTPSVPVPVPSSLVPGVGSASAPTAYRRALLIGNAAYPTAPLANPVNDATDMAAALRRIGFEVTLIRDADQATMERAVETFTHGIPRGSVGLFFFAGHGVQIDGVNYLLPVGTVFSQASDVKYRAVAADWILGRMEDTGIEVKLLILDACRNNPFGRTWTRSLDRGLAVMDSPQGALIAYATSPRKTAADGTGRNSPYTARLLRELPIPERPIELVFKAVRVGVQLDTQGAQIPWEASSLTGDFYFAR